ncbi:TRAP transporter small permease [Bordetella tumulicola]|uniref:TRAP transporter small permease n=1 Tax=Bordetella tumulicola TaxID=1649133 RepID=UPI0039F02A06
MRMLRLAESTLFKVVSVLAQILLVGAALAAFYQVIARFVLQSPADWSEVLTRALLIWTVFLGISLAFRRGAMISVELLHNLLQGPRRRLLEHVIAIVCVVFLVFLAWVGGQMTYRVRFQNVPSLNIPISWIYVSIPIGCTLAAIAVLTRWLLGADEPAPVRNDAQG